MNFTNRSPFYKSESERRNLMRMALIEGENPFEKEAENPTKPAMENEVEEDNERNIILDTSTPWTVLFQHAMRYVSPVMIQDNAILVENSKTASNIAEAGLGKCLIALQNDALDMTEEGISKSQLRGLVLRQLSSNRVARRSLVSTLRFLRSLDGETLLELEDELKSQNTLLAKIKATAYQQVSNELQNTTFGTPPSEYFKNDLKT